MCGGPSKELARYDLSAFGGYWSEVGCDTRVEIRRCTRFGSFFTASVPSPALIVGQYEKVDASYYDRETSDPTHKVARCVELVQRFVAPGARVIDVGGGNGAFAIAARRAGFESWLQEHAQIPVRRLESENVAWVSALEDAPAGSFDLVTLWDVYEHVWPHDEFLAPIRRALKPGGMLAIEIPSPSRLVPIFVALGWLYPSPRREWALAQICNFTHLQLMTARELEHTLPKLGFEVLHTQRFSELSYRGVSYARRVIPSERAARWVGSLFDQRWVRALLLGSNKTFVAARRAS
jgi:2-polyprenyl-3-methyl-5-hydroxy-6-metoxy-1,4-benzoquinol methylase